MNQFELRKTISEKTRLLRHLEASLKEDEAASDRSRRLAHRRRRFLSEIALRDSHPYPDPIVFISYASKSGSAHKERAVEEFRNAGFHVRLGWDAAVQEQRDKLTAIKTHIKGCSSFLGILTPEYYFDSDRSSACPGPWVLEEKGIAEAYEIPMRLLVNDSIHQDFYTKVGGDKLHNIFGQTDFETQLTRAVEALYRRYHERLILDYVT